MSKMGLQIVTTIDSAENIMAKDAKLLEDLAVTQQPILHLYRFEAPSITYGHFITIDQMLKLDELKKEKIQLAKRPTGGGIIFHLYDLAFSFLLPSSHPKFSMNTLDNYAYVNQIVKQAIIPFIKDKSIDFLPLDPKDPTQATHFCMAKPTIYDVMIGDKKIVGAAQRKKNQGLLHQGSIAIQAPSKLLLEKILLNPDEIVPKMTAFSHYFLDSFASENEKEELIKNIQDSLLKHFQSALSESSKN